MAQATVSVMESPSRRAMIFTSWPRTGYFFLRGPSIWSEMARTMVSASEKGAWPTPNEVSFARGFVSWQGRKTSRRSVDPTPSLQSTMTSRSRSAFVMVERM